jgi:hypothetical protein
LGLFIAVLVILPGIQLRGQTQAAATAVDTLRIEFTPQRLSHLFLIDSTDSLYLAGNHQLLERDKHYRLDARYGIVSLDSSVFRLIGQDARSDRVVAHYRYLPFRFRDTYAKRSLVPVPSQGDDTLRIARPQSEFELDDIFGPNLQKSGSIVRGITVGSNRDFTLNSGLRLQLSGKITQDVDVIASLTDENTPIQPEGTTQTLQEFDKVFVELRGNNFDLVLGDFAIGFEGTEFARLNRKLQGARGSVRFGSAIATSGELVASGAVPRGKFHTNEFRGLEGVQGPYNLSGRNNEPDIIVIAGTEKVFVNGEQMVRGETNDFTIDYSLAQVTFTPRRLITSASRIVIDFEYTDRQFGRSFIATEGKASFFGEAIGFGVTFFREGDDKDDPIDLVLSDSSREILEGAGDDRNSAVTSGVTVVDSNGFYIQVDTLVAGSPVSFYRYQPGPEALYIITFSLVGAGNGDYDLIQPGVYQWKGAGGGAYLPVKFLPLPQSHTVIDYRLKARPSSDVLVAGEFAQSIFDANTFSSLDDEDNQGTALDVLARYTPERIRMFGESIGTLDLSVKHRLIDQNFVPIDRVNEIEFTRKWGIDSLQVLDERLTELSASYLPVPAVALGAGMGSFERGDVQSSTRREANLRLADTTLPRLGYALEEIDSRDERTSLKSEWLRHRGTASHELWAVIPSFRFEREERELSPLAADSLSAGSFRFQLLAPGLRIPVLGPLSLSGEYEWRTDDSVHSSTGALARESDTFTQSYQVLLRGLSEVSTTLDVTLRDKDVMAPFEGGGHQDVQTVLVRNQTRYAPLARWFDATAFYEVSTQQAAPLQRAFLKVTPGSGNYRYLGDLNNNGVADEAEFELTRYDGDYVAISVPGNELLPVIDLKTSLRIGFRPSYLVQGGGGWMAEAIAALSSETYFRIDEKSTEPDLKEIYLLHFSRFLQDSTTLAGSQLLTQDVNLFDQSPLVSMRFRFQERKSLTRYSDGSEHAYVREHSVRLRSQFVAELSQQFDYIRRTDQANSAQSSRSDRDILSNSLIFDFSYRPEQDFELGFQFEVTGSVDRFPGQESEADINSEGLRAVYSFQGLGQARGELTREETVLRGNAQTVPFELTGGRVPGKTWLWRLAFDYRVAQFIQATVGYDGRSEGGSRTVHTARAEVQAFF